MGSGLQPGGSLTNHRARRRPSPIADINVTAMVGVMAVLLIIFMITAPRLSVGVGIDADAALPPVELPAAGAGTPEMAPLSITIDADGRIFLQDTEISFDEVVPKLVALREAGGGAQVWVRGEESTSYGDVAKVLVRIKEAGLPVTLVTGQGDRP